MTLVKAYFGCLVAFLILDAFWLGWLMKDFYRKHIGQLMKDNPDWAAAAIFYSMYLAGIVFLAVRPALQQEGQPGALLAGSWLGVALLNGAVLGLVAYGTYGFTNLATLKSWPASMVLIDTAWGIFITSVTAGVGAWAARLG